MMGNEDQGVFHKLKFERSRSIRSVRSAVLSISREELESLGILP